MFNYTKLLVLTEHFICDSQPWLQIQNTREAFKNECLCPSFGGSDSIGLSWNPSNDRF